MQNIKLVQRTIVYIEDHLLMPFTLDDVGSYIEESPYHINQMFTMITGKNIYEYTEARRMSEAAADLKAGTFRLVDIAEKYGYEDAHAFSNAFSEYHGISPIQVRQSDHQLKFFNRQYIKLTTTDTPPLNYTIHQMPFVRLTGKKITIQNSELDNHFLLADMILDFKDDGIIDALSKVAQNEKLYVITKPFMDSIELFIGVEADRSYHFEEYVMLSGNYAHMHIRGHLDYIFNQLWMNIETQNIFNIQYELNEQYIYIFDTRMDFTHQYNRMDAYIPLK